MPTLERDDVTLHYEDQGEGDALLLLHAFPLHSGMWAPQRAALSKRFRVIALDARGFGRSRPAPEMLTMELFADDAARVLAKVGVRGATVCGLSMGGYAALSFWRRHRDRVRALVLADTRAGGDTPEGKVNREGFARNALERGAQWIADDMLPKLLRQPPRPEAERELRRLMAGVDPAAVAAAQRGMAARLDSTPLLATIDVPTLVLCGSDDGLTPPSEARALASAIPKARMLAIAGAGHLSSLDAPFEFSQALAGFLATL